MPEDKHRLKNLDRDGNDPPAPRPGVVLIVGGLMLLALLAGAAFAAGRLMAGGSLLSPKDVVFRPGTDLGLLKPTQLPEAPPDLEGPFQRREDNSLFVAQAAGGGAPDGPVNAAGGPTTEVVITHDTLIYADVTSPPSPGDLIEGGMLQLQATQVDNIEEIGEGSVIMVWGEWRGGRLFASVIYYDQQ